MIPGTSVKLNQALLIFSLLILIAGCETTMVPITDTQGSPVRLSIAVGDTVRVLTKYGDRPTFEVTDITETVLIGKNQSIRYDDMAFVEKQSRQGSKGNALAVILALVAGAVLVEGLTEIGPGFPSVQ